MATQAAGQSKIKRERARKEAEGKEGGEKEEERKKGEKKREREKRKGNLQIIRGSDYSETNNQS